MARIGGWLRTAVHAAVPGLCAMAGPIASAAELELGEIAVSYTLTGSYAAAMRLEKPHPGIVDAPGDPRIPVAEDLKYPQSNNFDDGDRNFAQYDLVNNRVSVLGDVEFSWNDFGALLRGDAFYDWAYHGGNAHDAPERINTSQQPYNSFTKDAQKYSGERARLLDAYVYGSIPIGDTMSLQLRIGRHIAAWGQSLFFSGVALAQSTADATRATVPGADVKSILLPINQISARFTLTDDITLLGQYVFEFKPFEVNPVGDFYSPSDLVGPGPEIAYGFLNPLAPDNLAVFDLTDINDIADIVLTIDEVFDGQLPTDALEAALRTLPLEALPSLFFPQAGVNPLNSPYGVNPTYAGEKRPDDKDKQYGFGVVYALDDVTELGAYYLRYHQKTPTVELTFGSLDLIPAQTLPGGIVVPAITTSTLGLNVPEVFRIAYFDNVDLYALSFSTLIFGVNVGGEVIRREGIDTLLDVDEGVNGIIPEPTRASSTQVLINAISVFRPPVFFDSVALVGEVGWVMVDDIEPLLSHEGANEGQPTDRLSFDREAWALATLMILDRGNVFQGWDLRIPISYQHALKGRSALNGGFGSLFDRDDIRVGVGVEMTWLQDLTVGVNYSGFMGGKPHFNDRPLADRDTVGFSLKYRFF
jgi:hypothetical protein